MRKQDNKLTDQTIFEHIGDVEDAMNRMDQNINQSSNCFFKLLLMTENKKR